MTQSDVRKHETGTTQHVLAHARWRASRGRRPSLPFLGEFNPERALKLARIFASGKGRTRIGEDGPLFHPILETPIKCLRREEDAQSGVPTPPRRDWRKMNDGQIRNAVRDIVVTSSSKNEVRLRIQDELDFDGFVNLHTRVPKDTTGRETRELGMTLGGLMQNGAMIQLQMWGHDGAIQL